jgi:hypothetical protein
MLPQPVTNNVLLQRRPSLGLRASLEALTGFLPFGRKSSESLPTVDPKALNEGGAIIPPDEDDDEMDVDDLSQGLTTEHDQMVRVIWSPELLSDLKTGCPRRYRATRHPSTDTKIGLCLSLKRY